MAEEIVIGKEALIRKFRKLSEISQGMSLATAASDRGFMA